MGKWAKEKARPPGGRPRFYHLIWLDGYANTVPKTQANKSSTGLPFDATVKGRFDGL